MILKFFKDNWFMVGLIAVPLIVIADIWNVTVSPGIWFKNHHGPDFVIVLIFFLSGLALNTRQIRDGITDIKGTLLALFLIFIAAPLIALVFSLLPLQTGIILGIFLVSAMPTTLSSGVVMTGSAGGNMAHSLLITIIANGLAIITIPVTLTILLGNAGGTGTIEIDQLGIMVKLATLVLLPLIAGIVFRNNCGEYLHPFLHFTTRGNQLGILAMVWMAVCAGRNAIVSELGAILIVIITVFFFHLLLVLAAVFLARVAGVQKGKRESIIFMGGQKTLPLSVILQVSLFPDIGIALVVCVMHHIIHLIMDGALIKYLKGKEL